MSFMVKIIIFVWASSNNLTKGFIISYEELKELNATCYPEDTCMDLEGKNDSPGISWSQTCSCNRLCSQFKTCCIDSFYNNVKSPMLQPMCTTVHSSYIDTSYFMVDRCNRETVWDKQCNDEWKEEDDVMKLVPVTSLFTSMTYKNYFCFKCHENTDDYLYWNVWLKSNTTCDNKTDMMHDELTYSSNEKTWVVTFKKSGIWMPVDLKFDIPKEIWSLPIECEPDLISNCSQKWTNESVALKCKTYTAVIFIEREGEVLEYRNAHCALCNFESLDKMICKSHFEREGVFFRRGGNHIHSPVQDVGTSSETDKGVFSFNYLLDINRSDGDKVGKIQRCGKNLFWDPFAKKCRALTCGLPGFILKGKKCVRQ